MLPIFKKLRDKEVKPSGVIVQSRQVSQEPNVIEDLKPCAVHMLMAISVGDADALAQAVHEMHEIMHQHMDKEQPIQPHSYESQRE